MSREEAKAIDAIAMLCGLTDYGTTGVVVAVREKIAQLRQQRDDLARQLRAEVDANDDRWSKLVRPWVELASELAGLEPSLDGTLIPAEACGTDEAMLAYVRDHAFRPAATDDHDPYLCAIDQVGGDYRHGGSSVEAQRVGSGRLRAERVIPPVTSAIEEADAEGSARGLADEVIRAMREAASTIKIAAEMGVEEGIIDAEEAEGDHELAARLLALSGDQPTPPADTPTSLVADGGLDAAREEGRQQERAAIVEEMRQKAEGDGDEDWARATLGWADVIEGCAGERLLCRGRG